MRSLRFLVSQSSLCLLSSIFLCPSAVLSQEHAPAFRRVTVNDGLSQSTVNTIVQDQAGFIWFGTQSGLNRYDGYACTVFKNQPGDSTSLSDNVIVDLMVDNRGVMWVATYNGGLNVLDSRKGEFRRYALGEAAAGTGPAATVSSLYQDARGRHWIGTWGGGLLLVEGDFPGPVSLRRFRHDGHDSSSLVDDRVADIAQTPDGSLWVAAWSGLSRLDAGPDSIVRFRNFLPGISPGGLADSCLWALDVDSAGHLWIGSYQCGLTRLDPVSATFEKIEHPAGKQKGVSSLLKDRAGRMWIGTPGSGLFMSLKERGSFRQFRKSAGDVESLSDDDIRCLYEDRSGVVWIGTANNGASSYHPRREQFKHIKHNGSDEKSLNGDVVRAFARDAVGGLWVGTSGGGANYLPPGSLQFRHYRHDPADAGTLASDNVRALCVRANGDVWMGTEDAGVSVLRRSTQRFFRLCHDPSIYSSLSRNTVTCILEDRRGTVWVGTAGGGLDRWDERTVSFVHHRAGADSLTLSGDWVWSLCEDREQRLWVGTWGKGLSILDRERASFRRIRNRSGDTTSLPNNTVLCIAEDRAGTVWVGTEGGGLCRVNPQTGRVQRFMTEDGMSTDIVCSIVPDREGILWISGMNGLIAFDPRNGERKVYTQSDGLQGGEFSPGASILLPDGQICIGGINGFNMFNAALVQSVYSGPAPLVISSVKVYESPVTSDMFDEESGKLVLNHDQDALSIEFAALDFCAPETARYTYLLEGFDRTWVQSGTRRYASYTRLKGGEYVFRVRARDVNGGWSGEEATLRITVVSAVWNRWWFHLTVVVLIALAVRIHIQYRMSQLLALERMRVRIASDLHDDIGSTLTKIAVQSEVIRTTKDTETAAELAQHIGSASREIISALSDIVWSIDPRHDTVGNLLDRMRDFSSDVLGSRHIDVAFSHLGLVRRNPIDADLRQNVYMIFKEAVSNIARHSNASEARIAIENSEREFRMTIVDNGTNWQEPARGDRHGLRNMEMRAARIRASLTLDTRTGVTITLVARPLRAQ